MAPNLHISFDMMSNREKKSQDKNLILETDDQNQVVQAPTDSGYDDTPDRHRGLPMAVGAAEQAEIPPRNQWNGTPGFDHAEELRKKKAAHLNTGTTGSKEA